MDNRGIRAVKCVLRFVSCTSLVGLRIFSWQEMLYGLSIRTDRTDRQQGYTVCKGCFTVRKSHLIIVGLGIFSWQEWL